MNNFPTRETPRLLLRELTPQDAPRLLEMYGDAQAMQWLGSDPITELAQAQALIETFATWRQQATTRHIPVSASRREDRQSSSA